MQKNSSQNKPVLEVQNLSVEFQIRRRKVNILTDINLSLNYGQTLAIVGESGSGKSMTALSIMRLIPSPPGRISAGRIMMGDEDLIQVSEKRIREIRGRNISMIFQEPMTSLNPVYTIGNQIAETIKRHKKCSSAEAKQQVIELLRLVDIPAPERRLNEYPYQLSGGMRQRVMIAMALACDPEILIADEPTTALDVTVQAQIFDLLKGIQARKGTCSILITHDFGAVAEMADRVIVMYAGRMIEEGTVDEVINGAMHPYTQGLLKCMPEIELGKKTAPEPLVEISGAVPDLLKPLKGCPFATRCSYVMAQCDEMPPTVALGKGRSVKCWLAQNNTFGGQQNER